MSAKARERMKKLSFARIQSSSSISTYRQCPRRYYYHYIEELASKPSIHLIRGKIAHSIVEDFFKIDIDKLNAENFEFQMKILLQDMLSRLWGEAEDDLKQLNMSRSEIDYYLRETKEMIQFWFLNFMQEIGNECKECTNLKEAFKKLTPKTEEHFVSEKIGVQGYVDAIHENDGKVKIIDYKTSKKNSITEDYKLQLAIYALLYHEKYGKYPDKVGLFLFRHGERLMDIDEEVLEFARKEVENIHLNTQSTDIKDYPKKKSFLCRWSTGQCDFYDLCQRE